MGGLFILGTERHESRRIDNQLRGRAGRQGDPGESCFFLSLEDDILRLFASDWIQSVMDKLGVDEDTPLDQKMLSNAIEKAQRKVESQNFQIRKTVLEYDDVMNTQREVIYKQRRQVLDGEDVHAAIENMLTTTVTNLIAGHTGEQGKLDEAGFKVAMAPWVNVMFTAQQLDDVKGQLGSLSTQALTDKLLELAHANYEHQADSIAQQLAELGQTAIQNPMGELERVILLRVVDEYWMDHIDAMTELRQGIGLRAYGQSDPVVEYKREGYDMFEEMIAAIQEETLRRLYSARIRTNQGIQRQRVAKVTGESGGSDKTVTQQPTKKTVKIGRNDPCPCGSGLKWKKCTCEQYHHGEE